MPLTSDLEKLIVLRDRGDLSPAEFQKAKDRLLSGDVPEGSPASEMNRPARPEKVGGDKPKPTLLVAILSTCAAAFSGGSAMIKPSALGALAFACFAVAATLNWALFIKGRATK